jgi:hypothetical protein
MGVQALASGKKMGAQEELLHEILDVAISAISVETADKHYGHSCGYLSDALQSKPL